AVGSIRRLEDKKCRDGVDRVLEPPLKKSRPVRPGKNPAVAQSQIPDRGLPCASRARVPATGPKLNFAAAIFGARPGPCHGSGKQQDCGNDCAHSVDTRRKLAQYNKLS